MKREVVVSTSIDTERDKKIRKIIADRILEGERASVSIILREMIDFYLDNKNGHNPTNPTKDDKPPAEQPAKNPFADINF